MARYAIEDKQGWYVIGKDSIPGNGYTLHRREAVTFDTYEQARQCLMNGERVVELPELPTPQNTGTTHDERRAIRREWINEALHIAHALGAKPNVRKVSAYVRECEQDNDTETGETVSLIASGYEWTCPKCDTLNNEIKTRENVTCRHCGASWPVDSYDHAEG